VRGRKPKPIEQRIAEGNRAKRALPPPIPNVDPVSAVAPAHLSGFALEHWNRVAPGFAKLGMLSVRHMAALEAWAMAYDIMRHAYEQWVALGRPLREPTGAGNYKKHTVLADFDAAAERVRSFAVEFGGTPSSTARIAGDIHRIPQQSKFDGLIGGKRATR
jgi:P27 family predicted phage terminase small subunit